MCVVSVGGASGEDAEEDDRIMAKRWQLIMMAVTWLSKAVTFTSAWSKTSASMMVFLLFLTSKLVYVIVPTVQSTRNTSCSPVPAMSLLMNYLPPVSGLGTNVLHTSFFFLAS